MPKRTDLKSILLVGSGPIVIGQACEFDYSGTQACRALKEEGYRVILVNSNPATIMTDPEFADRTYVESLTVETLEKIIKRERPSALLPTVGGQTALNLALALAKKGVLERYGVELIGAKISAIEKAEDRFLFKQAVEKLGLRTPKSGIANSLEEAVRIAETLGFPLIIRPAFTMGGSGGSLVYNLKEFESVAPRGLSESPISQILIEESVAGWKEYELEIMRDLHDNVVIICSIENLDPMGVHTGDSITVAPAQTLTDREYQIMRNAAIAIIREIGVDTGGSNIQFAVDPQTGRMLVIEMNPRVSRSSALASKATGFPIAKIAAKLAVGYTLDELPNDITKSTLASFEPTIDYVVTKIPRWAFEKFPDADATLGSQMKSVGEAMAIGRTFKESFQKALRSLEIGRYGFGYDGKGKAWEPADLRLKLSVPNVDRLFAVQQALDEGMTPTEVQALTKMDPWFLDQLAQIVEKARDLKAWKAIKKGALPPALLLREAKSFGFSDRQLAVMWGVKEATVRSWRERLKVKPVYKMVDTCAAEFEASTPYLYSTYEIEDEVPPTSREKIMILGGGPNRIGQGIEFDYCCVHAAFALKASGYEVIMVNCNPETVSTDYDTSDRLYFEPLTLEDVLHIYQRERPKGVIVQFGGQTPLRLAMSLKQAKVKILGTDPVHIDVAEDRRQFGAMLKRLNILQPNNGSARSVKEAKKVAAKIGYPVLVRPSYVLGGRAMEIVYDEGTLEYFMRVAVEASPEHPVLIDEFLEDAIEIDVDAVADGTRCVVAGIMEHIEEAGIHSGDSSCVLPPYSLPEPLVKKIRTMTHTLAKSLSVVGLMNIQYAIKGDRVYVLEVNPRASRTVPFVSKATGIPWAKIAANVMAGISLDAQGIQEIAAPKHVSVKEPVFPFNKFPGVDPVLGPEMKSTGEVMGIDENFGRAFAKAHPDLPTRGTVFISVNNKDKRTVPWVAKKLADMGFAIMATGGTANALRSNGITVEEVLKVNEGRPNIVDMILDGKVDLVINTPMGKGPKADESHIRRSAVLKRIPCVTTISGAGAAVNAIEAVKREALEVRALQDYHNQVDRL